MWPVPLALQFWSCFFQGMIFNVGMSIWILAFVLMACLGALGFRQGAIRVAFSFVAIILATLLAVPLAGLFKPLLPWFGVKNPVLIWALGPFLGFWLVQALVKYGAFHVHRNRDVYYKHKASELELSLWTRLNSRLGLCLGLLNGTAYFILICFVIFNLSYWTTQVGASTNQPFAVRLVNQLGSDLETTGLARVAQGVGKLPADFYRDADLTGFLLQNPQVGPRLQSYPGLTSFFQRPDIQSYLADENFTNLISTGGSVGDLWNSGPVQQFFGDAGLRQLVTGEFTTNYDDMVSYLQTGKSAKYDGEKILGNWTVNINVTLAWMRQDRPKMTANEMRAARAWYSQAYGKTTLLATGEGEIFIKNFPVPKTEAGKAPTTDLMDVQGHWTKSDAGYDLDLKINDQDKFYSGPADALRMTLKDGRNQLIFDRQ